MVQPQSIVYIADNTGVRKIMCIRVLNKRRQQIASLGDIIIGVVKEVLPTAFIKKSEIVLAVIVRTSARIRRQNGTYIRFDENAAVLINKDKLPRGNRIFGPIPRELRNKNFTKILSLAPEVI